VSNDELEADLKKRGSNKDAAMLAHGERNAIQKRVLRTLSPVP
jgi:hypothetical protein